MASFVSESGAVLEIERRAPKKSEEDLRAERTTRFVKLLDQAGDLRPGAVDTLSVRRALSQSDDLLEREASQIFRAGFQRLMLEAAAGEK